MSAIPDVLDGRVVVNMLEDRQNWGSVPHVDALADGWFDQPSSNLLPGEYIDELPTVQDLSAMLDWSHHHELEMQYNWDVDEMATWILPVIGIASTTSKRGAKSIPITPEAGVKDHIALLRNFVKSSGVYAIASVTIPLINLVLAPFLTHKLSPSDYGVLTILTTFISLAAGITQLGLGSAFFRAYGYDYTSDSDRKDVLASVTSLLCLISTLTAGAGVVLAPFLAGVLFGRSSLGTLVASGGWSCITAKSHRSWLCMAARGESGPFLRYSINLQRTSYTYCESGAGGSAAYGCRRFAYRHS